MATASDQELWATVVAAHRELHRVQADFHQNAQDRVDVLRAALGQHSWDQTTALRYLDVFSHDTLALLPELVDLVVSDRTHGWACEAISHLPIGTLMPALKPIIAERLDREDVYEYQCLGSLLGRIQAWDLLTGLVQRAMHSKDPAILESGRSLQSHYPILRGQHEPHAEPNP